MLTGQYISINRIVERIYKSGLNPDNIYYDDIVEWVGEAIAKIGVSYAFKEVVSPEIVVADYRASLPTDLVSIYSVREYDNQYPMVEISGSFRPEHEDSNLPNDNDPTMLGYFVNNGYIFTNFEEGSIEIDYKAFVTDDDGCPKIPDDERYITAVVSYCEYQLARKMWLQDKLSDKKFQMLEQDWLFYVNSAKTKSHMPNVDGAESLKNQMTRLIKFSHHHASGFRYRNQPEILKTH